LMYPELSRYVLRMRKSLGKMLRLDSAYPVFNCPPDEVIRLAIENQFKLWHSKASESTVHEEELEWEQIDLASLRRFVLSGRSVMYDSLLVGTPDNGVLVEGDQIFLELDVVNEIYRKSTGKDATNSIGAIQEKNNRGKPVLERKNLLLSAIINVIEHELSIPDSACFKEESGKKSLNAEKIGLHLLDSLDEFPKLKSKAQTSKDGRLISLETLALYITDARKLRIKPQKQRSIPV
jgi:hypothetical protein